MTKLIAHCGTGADSEHPDLKERGFYRATLEIDVDDLRKLQTWGNAHLITIDIKDGEKTARYIVSVGVDGYTNQTKAQLLTFIGKTKTEERVGKWIRGAWINFAERLREIRAALAIHN